MVESIRTIYVVFRPNSKKDVYTGIPGIVMEAAFIHREDAERVSKSFEGSWIELTYLNGKVR